MRALAVVAIAAAVVVVPPSATAHAATDTRNKLVVLAGSNGYLAYARYPVTATGQPDREQGTLHVLAAHGADRVLGTTFTDTDPLSADRYEYSLVDSTLTAFSPGNPTAVQWWNLVAGTSGTATLPTGARWQGSAPGGWVIVKSDNTTLAVESTTGHLTSYGQPLPDEASLPGVIDAVSGPHGVVTVGEDLETMAYQPWGSPEAVVALNEGNPAGSPNFRCQSVSYDEVGCIDPGIDSDAKTNIAVPLDGSGLTTYPGCGSNSTALGKLVIFVCGGSPAHARFASDLSVLRSPVKVSPWPGVSAFGHFVTTAAGGRALIALGKDGRQTGTLVSVPGVIAQLDADSLRAAASAVESAALDSGALATAPSYQLPAQILQVASDALIAKARAADPGLGPVDTRSIMGPVPHNLAHHSRRHPHHRHITRTRSLRRFSHAVADRGSGGLGLHHTHGGAHPASLQRADGVYVDPVLPPLTNPTVGMVALRAAMRKLGQPYVWAAAGPTTFDCSGLVQWAYAHAGVHFTHFTGSQWNEGRLIPPRDILPGDLILFEYRHSTTIHHVGMYLGAGWMINAPYTGQYVSVTPVPSGVAGVIRP